eukprot:GFUD01033385.1.p1 GENE.GFUD01033385.1~~GFUD01033385.1.p1  ORF type:complete len:192 (-),score=24.27 GFUD01033385.1:1-495(-)
MGVVVTGQPTSPQGAMGPYDFQLLTIKHNIQPALYPLYCFLECQKISDCNYWSFYTDQVFCQFWLRVDYLSPANILTMFAARSCNPDKSPPEDTTVPLSTTSTSTTSTTTLPTTTKRDYDDIAKEKECFSANTFSVGKQIGTLFPSPNAYSCAAACVANNLCLY